MRYVLIFWKVVALFCLLNAGIILITPPLHSKYTKKQHPQNQLFKFNKEELIKPKNMTLEFDYQY
jgi:hypothetical protein